MKVKVVKRFHDTVQRKIHRKDKILDVSEERGRYLISQGMAKEYVEPAEGQQEEGSKETKGLKAQKGQGK